MDCEELKIAMISAHSCPVGDLGARDTGGMSVYIRELSAALSRQGHTVDIYTRVHDPADPMYVEVGENARIIHLKAGEEKRLSKSEIYPVLPEFTRRIEAYREGHGLEYDIIFSHYWLSGWAGDCLKRHWNVPNVTMFHTLGALKNASGNGHNDSEFRISTERDIIKSSRRVIVATQREFLDIRDYYGARPEKTGLVPCGVNMEHFCPVDKQIARSNLGFGDGTTLLYVGRIDPIKGIDRLIKALALLEAEREMRLVIVGGDETSRREQEKLQALAAELGITDRIEFRGMVKHDLISEYYSAADITVLPSYYESFGLVALESLSCGTPVVASDVGDLKNIIVPGRTGWVTVDNEPENLADGIRRVINAPELESPSGIRASVAEFRWEFIAEGIASELCRALQTECECVN